MSEHKEENRDNLREFEENPYTPDKKRPEDILRVFYSNNLPIVPVVSRRGMLLGILKKDEVVSELSDIDRAKDKKTDQFVTALAKKMMLDDLLPYISACREFVVINIFGEPQGIWSRLELLAAIESPQKSKAVKEDIERQKEKQIMEWMIYLILEHVPRAIYAVNASGGTIFYNSYFEDLFKSRMGRDVDISFIEKSLKNTGVNEFFTRSKGGSEIYFFNKDMRFYYEKVPLVSNEKNVGFLIYCDRDINSDDADVLLPGVDINGMGLAKILETVERGIIVGAVKNRGGDLPGASEDLGITRQDLAVRMKKYGIAADTQSRGKNEK